MSYGKNRRAEGVKSVFNVNSCANPFASFSNLNSKVRCHDNPLQELAIQIALRGKGVIVLVDIYSIM